MMLRLIRILTTSDSPGRRVPDHVLTRPLTLSSPVFLGMRTGQIEVIDVLPGGPAHEAGVRRGQILTAIDGVSLDAKHIHEVHELIRGAAGTRVRLSVKDVNEVSGRGASAPERKDSPPPRTCADRVSSTRELKGAMMLSIALEYDMSFVFPSCYSCRPLLFFASPSPPLPFSIPYLSFPLLRV